MDTANLAEFISGVQEILALETLPVLLGKLVELVVNAKDATTYINALKALADASLLKAQDLGDAYVPQRKFMCQIMSRC